MRSLTRWIVFATLAATMMFLPVQVHAQALIKQTGTSVKLVFLLVSNTDHISPATGQTVTVTISKNGASFGSPAGTVAEIGSGLYALTPSSTDTNTLGFLALHATASGADPTDVMYFVVAFDPGSSSNLGLSFAPTAAPGTNGGLPTVDGSNKVAGLQGITFPANFNLLAIDGNGYITVGTLSASALTAITNALLNGVVQGTLTVKQALQISTLIAANNVQTKTQSIQTNGTSTGNYPSSSYPKYRDIKYWFISDNVASDPVRWTLRTYYDSTGAIALDKVGIAGTLP